MTRIDPTDHAAVLEACRQLGIKTLPHTCLVSVEALLDAYQLVEEMCASDLIPDMELPDTLADLRRNPEEDA